MCLTLQVAATLISLSGQYHSLPGATASEEGWWVALAGRFMRPTGGQ
ncbi:hypothetical protein IOCL2690_000462800 [Leishmania lindenbergi]|uniref:Uncharacterized protein n=1 Tax=Leishmania lindenbergi TaxID=651832 RepID=A0AAW3AC77_9TRYP